MNAGAYGGEMKDILQKVTVLTPDGTVQTLSVKELELSYRHSIIGERISGNQRSIEAAAGQRR